MKTCSLIPAVGLVLAGATGALAQSASSMIAPGISSAETAITGPASGPVLGRFVRPSSSFEQPIGSHLMRTHHRVFVPVASPGATPQTASPATVGAPPYTGYYWETPASLACIYGLTPNLQGCDSNKLVRHATGGSKAIALVDAYDAPNAKSDFAAYSTQFGLPTTNIRVVYATGTQPSYNAGWAEEATLDIEMAHAMAPSAIIYLVEAASNSFADLDVAVDKAYTVVRAAGGGEISMSYGAPEYSGDTSEETHYSKTGNIVFFASSGDNPGVEYPSSSPHVVGVGGTNTSREMINTSTFGRLLEETAWAEAGGGVSTLFARPSFQSSLAGRFAGVTKRVVPDVGAVASNLTPVWIYFNGAWQGIAGTSVASPLVAGLTNHAATFRANSAAELTYIYSRIGTASYFDVSKGVCGPQAGFFASAKTSSSVALAYDLCTGIGAPRGDTAF